MLPIIVVTLTCACDLLGWKGYLLLLGKQMRKRLQPGIGLCSVGTAIHYKHFHL